jgi:hypothetical protein
LSQKISTEIVADDLERLALLFALVVHHHHARLLAKGRISQHQVEPVAGIAAQTVIGLDRRFSLGASRADPVLRKGIDSATSENRCRVRKGCPAGSIELRVSLPPLKFRTAGFPQYGFKWTVNGDLRRCPKA